MGYIKTKQGAKIYMYRANTQNNELSSDEYLPESQFTVGVNEITPSTSHTSLTEPIPIYDGVVNDDGTNTLTGSVAGENSTNNTTTFKPGGGVLDNTAQNLISNDTEDWKQWSISDLSSEGVNININQYCGLWLYFRNHVLDCFTEENCIEIRLGSDDSNYYYKRFDKSQFNYGWNWLNLSIVSSLNEEGSVVGDVSYFSIIIRTNNASDSWEEGDVVYDLLRQWDIDDLFKDYVTDYPQIDLDNLEVTKQAYLTSIEAVGFLINGYGDWNKDTIPKLGSKARIAPRSKADTDEIIFITKDRIVL